MVALTKDWTADVRKYVASPNENAITGIVRYCGIALQKQDSSLVSFNDKEEVERVRENLLKKETWAHELRCRA